MGLVKTFILTLSFCTDMDCHNITRDAISSNDCLKQSRVISVMGNVKSLDEMYKSVLTMTRDDTMLLTDKITHYSSSCSIEQKGLS